MNRLRVFNLKLNRLRTGSSIRGSVRCSGRGRADVVFEQGTERDDR